MPVNKKPNSKPFKILLVEDNDADIYLLRQALNLAGLNFQLKVIKDGAEALAYAKRDTATAVDPVPDLAVLDLNLPKVGGLEVLGALRENRSMSEIPVAIMTSSASPHDKEKANELGIDRFITKPPDLDVFLQLGEVFKEILEEIEERAPNQP